MAPLLGTSWLQTPANTATNDKGLVVLIRWLGLVVLKMQCSTAPVRQDYDKNTMVR